MKAVKVVACLFAGAALSACDSTEKPNVPLGPVVGARVGPQSTDFAAFVSGLIATQTLENNSPARIDSTLFENTQDPHAFDDLFAE